MAFPGLGVALFKDLAYVGESGKGQSRSLFNEEVRLRGGQSDIGEGQPDWYSR